MTRGFSVAAAAICLVCSASAFSQDKGYWRAASNNASQITGDVQISETRLTIDFIGFSLASIRKLTQAEAGAAFDVDVNVAGAGNLFRLSIPGDKRFLHRNSLCGSEETQWMATFVQDRALHIAFFSGPKMPVLTGEALSASNDVCGVFSYVR